MRVEGKSTRYYERRHLRLPLEVSYRESDACEWTEHGSTEQLTICGVGFALSRIVEPKRLVRLKLPMPKSYRLFDHVKELYEVWGLVRYVQLLESDAPDRVRLMVGASLIGKSAPPSYLRNPQTHYDLKPVLKREHFWDWRELPRRNGPFGRSLEVRRPESVPIWLEPVDEAGRLGERSPAATLNVSESGAAVVAHEPAAAAAYVRVTAQDRPLELLAAVRGRHRLENDAERLHLEFISGKWVR